MQALTTQINLARMASAQLVAFIEKQAGECVTPSPSITHTPGILTSDDFYPDRSGDHVVPTWKSPDVVVIVSFLFPCWCLDIVKIDKTPLIYSFRTSIWGLSPPNPPEATGLAVRETWKSIAVPRSIWLPNNCRKVFAHCGQGWLMWLKMKMKAFHVSI